ncbi:hypothetical protein Cyrtocomes_00021 [Candidatus Cyrtobacter comes]|uniref:Uncharacterized protein n=1 Tax=Candidatus Cyrtobacter comes TaxID=675776 RepID=A0ABU5L713_9RICK|nr:hypothetical protein [Candidatus Cyrtobacter comes]
MLLKYSIKLVSDDHLKPVAKVKIRIRMAMCAGFSAINIKHVT